MAVLHNRLNSLRFNWRATLRVWQLERELQIFLSSSASRIIYITIKTTPSSKCSTDGKFRKTVYNPWSDIDNWGRVCRDAVISCALFSERSFFYVEASRAMLEKCNREMSTKFRESALPKRIVITSCGMGLLNGMIHDGSCRAQKATTQFQVESSASAFINDENEIKT